ncbi:nitrogenase component 1 [Petroclostridium sp. X23]|uniref:nitrogenase component 1 n=1 Tax=Petroclostridium sp. X23 TaxID=3045146 RepID=UPI0024AD23D9|nr:nitrogenase component 1 [Petroclostridium sp. X23]WHH58726.1 nitrogenase component 1 [Petroclostridium sp. X23]
MHKLAIKLPPFSPDYSGAISALFELGGMMVIHDASGCTGNYTGYDEPRWYDSKSFVYCSALREIDAVMGNDDKFINRIVSAATELNPKFICLMGSPVPMIIGSDFEGIAIEIEHKTGIPTFGFATTGLKYYDKGASDALVAFSRRFVTQRHEKRPNTINMLGATPIDFTRVGTVMDFQFEFQSRGIEVLSTFAMGSSLEQLSDSSAAAVNIVVSASGLAVAEYFSGVFGTPYVIGQPIGTYHTDNLCKLIQKAQDTGENQFMRIPEDTARILLIGEHVTMHSLRACLYEDLGISGVDIGCPFRRISQINASNDMALLSEKDIKNIANSGKYTHIIGDPFFEQLITEPLHFTPLPHVAVSSKVHWEKPLELAGEKINKILKGIM